MRELTPNPAIVGTFADRIAEIERIREKADPDHVLMTPSGVPGFDQDRAELRLLAKEVTLDFK